MIGLDEIQALLDDHFVKTISIRGSAFVKPIENEVKEWFDTLNRMNMTLEEWQRVQTQWLYLMPIFCSGDIVVQMPEEGIQFDVILHANYVPHWCAYFNYLLFQEINAVVRRLLSMVDSDPLAIKCVGQEGILESLIQCTAMMESINLGVNSYLEKKRLLFAR